MAWASLAANIVIMVTGGLVRLTGSGLGCPTWPRCTDTSWTTTPEMGLHGAIEFGNRLLTFVLVLVATATLIAGARLRHRHPGLFRLVVPLWLGIPLQAVVGGFTVRMQLNPSVVGIHFLISTVLVVLATLLVERTSPQPSGTGAPPAWQAQRVPLLILAVGVGVLVYLGTLVTGAGPHAGDAGDVARHSLDLVVLAKLHAWTGLAVTALTLWFIVLTRRADGRHPAVAARLVGLGTLLVVQAAIGYFQYFNGLPILAVTAHVAGAALVTAFTTAVVERGLRG